MMTVIKEKGGQRGSMKGLKGSWVGLKWNGFREKT